MCLPSQADFEAAADRGVETGLYRRNQLKLATGPKNPDMADEAIQKARTSAFLRTQMGKNQGNSFATNGASGNFNVGAPRAYGDFTLGGDYKKGL